MKKNNKKNPCEKYELAITNYALGEEMGMSKEELYEHLATCKKCQQDLKEWSSAIGILRAEVYDAKPESKNKRAELLSKIKGQAVPHPKVPPTWNTVGKAAGEMWKCLGEKGPTVLTNLPQVCAMDFWLAASTYGWLLREQKLKVDQSKFPPIIQLTPDEQNRYFEETGQIEKMQ
ncbi:MAG TPA: hypothetical protein ENI23_03595 [bacterium]|nr:hypothetical protein [bacterium]